MHAVKTRSGPSEMSAKPQPRTARGSPVSPETMAEQKPVRRPTATTTPTAAAAAAAAATTNNNNNHNRAISYDNRAGRPSEMQQQFGQMQDELKKAKDERTWALYELAEAKKGLQRQKSDKDISMQRKERVEILELEVEKAKESEQKMLESLISQTKQLEQTKISLEEAKLELRTLQESARGDGPGIRISRILAPVDAIDSTRAQAEIAKLRNELKSATEAEDKSKKAMDDLAIALKEVTTQANLAKGQLSSSRSELEKKRVEVESLKDMLRVTEAKYRAAVEESERVKLEMDEAVSAWMIKENGFIDCMKVSEEEISIAKQENDRLIDSQRLAREDNSKLRDILKQAVNEATLVKEALEIARKENARLNNVLSEKERSLQSLKQEYDCLRVSEAAAVGSVRELKSLLAATSVVDSERPANHSLVERSDHSEGKRSPANDSKLIPPLPPIPWGSENQRLPYGRRHSVGEPVMFKDPNIDAERPFEQKGRTLSSISNVTDSRVTSLVYGDYGESMTSEDFDQIEGNQFVGMDREVTSSPLRLRKKKPMIRRFGDMLMLRRRSFHK